MKGRVVCLLAGLFLAAGCSKVSQLQRAESEFRMECYGDSSVRCRTMMVDVGIAKLKAAIELVEAEEEKYVACRGREAYDRGIGLIEEKIETYRDSKPNFFMRIFLSGAQIEFSPPYYRRDRELSSFIADVGECRRGKSASSVASTAPGQQRPDDVQPVSELEGEIDSNAPDVKGATRIGTGTLEKIEWSDGRSRLALNGKVLFDGEDAPFQSPLRVFKLSRNRDAVLVGSTGGRGTSCETLYFFLMADANSIKPTPLFGTCAPTGRFVQEGDRITLILPKLVGQDVYFFDGETLTQDGNPVQLNEANDPSK